MKEFQESIYIKYRRWIGLIPSMVVSKTKQFILCLFRRNSFHWRNSNLLKVNLEIQHDNRLSVNNALIKKSRIVERGHGNFIDISGTFLNVELLINGTNNRIVINDVDVIQNTTIIIKGENCLITLGHNTTINGAQIVCMGQNNSITIGDDCLFAQNVEIWATDSHPIFNIVRVC